MDMLKKVASDPQKLDIDFGFPEPDQYKIEGEYILAFKDGIQIFKIKLEEMLLF